MNVHLGVKSSAKNVFPKKIMFARLFDGAFKDFRPFREFTSDINVGCACIQCEAGDQNSFQQLMWIFVDYVAVLERARLRFIGITDQIHRSFFVRFDEAPLKPARTTRSATSTQPR